LISTVDGHSQAGLSGQGRRRARQPVPRTRRVEFTLTGEEYAVLVAAAGRAGLARRAYAAQAALAAAANGKPISDQESLGQALIELMRAAGLVRRIAANINQAVAKLNATGQPAGNLSAYAAQSIRRADHIDQVADAVRKALRQRSR
jgi:Mobilization protein NikA